MNPDALFGGIEGGGTKFICLVGRGPGDIQAEIQFPTTTPEETLLKALEFFTPYAGQLAAIGLAPFGPLNLDPDSPTYGQITATPKPGWTGTDVLAPFRALFGIPLSLDLDVNAAAFGEYTWVPENRGLDSLIYFTIGTGIGAGIIANGQLVHGLTHPEAGHVHLPHDRESDPFDGICRFHGDCFEGLASGLAITSRWGQPADALSDNHPAWELEAGYIAQALANIILTISPQRIVLGGGVMKRGKLFPLVRSRVRELLNGYISSPVVTGSMQAYIVPPGLGESSGVLGALALAQKIHGGVT
ncbi:MAG: ROK family protein [Chloroflexota bacterium]